MHPGYGFLAEDAGFAQRVLDAGLTWVGPPPDAIAAMGDKARARPLMKDAGVPVVRGSSEPLTDVDTALRVAAEIGYPVRSKRQPAAAASG